MFLALINQYKGLPKQIYIMLVARIVAATGAFVYPFITMLLSSRLHFSDQEISVYLLILAASYIPSALIGGRLADLFNRKYVYVLVTFIANITFFIAGFYCYSLSVIYLILIGYFFSNMGNPVIAAMMMDITNPQNRQESLSLCYLGANLGIAVGPLNAGFLFENYTSWIFWGNAIINSLAMLIIAIWIKDTRPDEQAVKAIIADDSRQAERPASGGTLAQLFKNPIIIIFALIGICYTFSYSQLSYIMPLHLEEIFGIAAGSKYIGAMWSINGLVVFISTPLMVLLFKKRNALLNISTAGIGYVLGFGLYAFTQNIIVILLLVIVWTCGEVLCNTNTGVFIANHTPLTHRARFQSIYEIIQGTGRAIGPLLMSSFLLNHSYSQGWLLVSLVSFSAVLGYYILYRFWLFNNRKTTRSKNNLTG